MFDIATSARRVSEWTAFGVELPAELAKAIEAFDAALFTEVGYQPRFDPAKITPKSVGSDIRKLAEGLALADGSAFGQSQSVLEVAKRRVVEALGQRVLGEARRAVPEVIDQLRPGFDLAAAAYVQAVSELPDDLTAESLVGLGADAVGSYQQARSAAGKLAGYDAWISSTADLTGFGGREREVTIRILAPENVVQLARLDEARHRRADATVSALNLVWLTAARLGIPFRLQTLAESAEVRANVTTARSLVSR
jgi:hypothetical protein